MMSLVSSRLKRVQVPEGWVVWPIFWLSATSVLVALSSDLGILGPNPFSRERQVYEFVEIPPPAPGDNVRPVTPGAIARPSVESTIEQNLDDPRALNPPYSGDMRFTLMTHTSGERYIVAEGDIEKGSAARFRDFLRKHELNGITMFLFSDGGLMAEAMSIGESVRAAELETRVGDTGYCYSSCPLILAAGAERSVSERGSVGLHQIYINDTRGLTVDWAYHDAQIATAIVWEYLERMGVDPNIWRFALETEPDNLYLLLGEQMKLYRLTNLSGGRDESN